MYFYGAFPNGEESLNKLLGPDKKISNSEHSWSVTRPDRQTNRPKCNSPGLRVIKENITSSFKLPKWHLMPVYPVSQAHANESSYDVQFTQCAHSGHRKSTNIYQFKCTVTFGTSYV